KAFFCSLFIFILASCSSKNSDSRQSSIQFEDNLPHDAHSSRLIAATNPAVAKDFTTKLRNGKEFKLSDYSGEIVILNIWATWCQPCVEEMPDLTEIYQAYKDQGVMILGVSIDEQGRSVVEPFVEKYNVTYPITIDDGTIIEKYGPTMGIPTTYIIGPKGYLRYFVTGALTKRELKPRLEKLLNES